MVARLVLRWVVECLNGAAYDVLPELLVDDFRLHVPPHVHPTPYVGAPGCAAYLRDVHATWAPVRTEVADLLVTGDRVVLRMRTTGTHRGRYYGAPATGVPVEFSQTCIVRVLPDGRMAEAWLEADQLGLMVTVGAAPAYGVTNPAKAFAWAVRTGLRRAALRLRRLPPAPDPEPWDGRVGEVVTDADNPPARELATNEKSLRRWIDECVNLQRPQICPEIFHQCYLGHSPPHAEPEPIRGPEGYAAFVRGILHGFPDAHAVIEDLVVVGDRAALRVRMTGTHLGVYRDMAPTGRRFDITQIVVFRMLDGKIVEHRQEIDALGLLFQFGYVPTHGFGPVGIVRWLVSLGVAIQRTAIRARRVQKGQS